MRDLRWTEICARRPGRVDALDPVQRISRQIGDAIRLHDPEADRATVRARVGELLERVGIGADRADRYPHEFSGGMRQRVMIALALACNPEVIIADEPTTALDVITQAQVLALLEELRRDLGLALLLITHDLAVIAETCERVAVMYAGQHRRDRPDRRRLRRAAASVHAAAARCVPAGRERARPAAGHPRDAARSRRSALRLPLPSPLPPRARGMRHGETALRPVGDDHDSACLFAPLQQTAVAGGVR